MAEALNSFFLLEQGLIFVVLIPLSNDIKNKTRISGFI